MTQLAAKEAGYSDIRRPFNSLRQHAQGLTRHEGFCAQVLMTQLAAKEAGYADVVYLDAKTDTCLEEVSSCNIFTVSGRTIRTPPLQARAPARPPRPQTRAWRRRFFPATSSPWPGAPSARRPCRRAPGTAAPARAAPPLGCAPHASICPSRSGADVWGLKEADVCGS